jgi:hypothetical protein
MPQIATKLDLFELMGNETFPEMREDWVDLTFLARRIGELADTEQGDLGFEEESQLREVTCRFIRWAIEHGNMKVGSMNEGWSMFMPWETSAEQSVERIVLEWIELKHRLTPGDIAWFTIDDV